VEWVLYQIDTCTSVKLIKTEWQDSSRMKLWVELSN